jgi:hypothetical protein
MITGEPKRKLPRFSGSDIKGNNNMYHADHDKTPPDNHIMYWDVTNLCMDVPVDHSNT